MAELSATPDGGGRRVAVIASRFNEEITRKLADGAMETLVARGVSSDHIDLIWVPGAWELPFAARAAATTDRYDCIVAVGAVIRGETSHYDIIANEASRGLADVSREFEIPIGFGLLTCEDDAQAEARSGGAHGNKGADAALAALEMADLGAILDTEDED
ncbi:MAG: 6,7-dimethyl-8-ribityllumazine synthase [Gemmatimonadaceae bacterium]|nr:6,7-dimethyl-8-ribityllumazine synthase [Gemmatimonadaceae bacterium]